MVSTLAKRIKSAERSGKKSKACPKYKLTHVAKCWDYTILGKPACERCSMIYNKVRASRRIAPPPKMYVCTECGKSKRAFTFVTHKRKYGLCMICAEKL